MKETFNTLFQHLWLLILSLVITVYSQGASIYVLPTEGPKVDEGNLESITALIQGAVSKHENQIHSLAKTREDAEIVLKPKLLRLGTAVLLQITRFNKDGSLRSDELRAESIEELDKVSARLVRAILDESPAKENATTLDVTAHEKTDGTNRKSAKSTTYFSVGAVQFSNLQFAEAADKDKIGTHIGIGVGWESDFGQIRFHTLDLGLQGSATLLSSRIGAALFANKNNFSPFIGASFGLTYMKDGEFDLADELFEEETNVRTELGLSYEVNAGFAIMRTSSVGLEAIISYQKLILQNSPSALVFKLALAF